MNEKNNQIQTASFIGVLLTVFSFSFGPWLGTRSGLWILADLSRFLSAPNAPADTNRQQTIFVLLLVFAFVLLIQAGTMVYQVLRGATRRLLVVGGTLSLLGLGTLSILYFGFQARTSGVFLTLAGLAITVVGNSVLLLRQKEKSTAPPPSLEILSPPPPQEAATDDRMLLFQQESARQFNLCRRQTEPFSLAVVGIAHFESYATIFGPEESGIMTAALHKDTLEIYPDGIIADFSVGAVMIGLPGVTKQQVFGMISAIAARMNEHGFVGEMLLPDGHIRLISGIVEYPHNGDNLGKLFEAALSAYAEGSSKAHPEI
jgi:GGDEF domain-containing protein